MVDVSTTAPDHELIFHLERALSYLSDRSIENDIKAATSLMAFINALEDYELLSDQRERLTTAAQKIVVMFVGN